MLTFTQEETLADVASIDIQQEIQWFMRPYLIDFLIEAHAAFQLLPETLFLAVNLLDRYCSRRVVYKRHYQLVGCAALLIAAKYGDRKERVPMIRELKSMCCALYDEEMFTQMEWHVLCTLEWSIGHPTVDSWIQLEMGGDAEDYQLQHMAWYLAEIALYHKDFVSLKASVMASASMGLARAVLGRPDSPEGYEHLEQLTMVNLSKKLHAPSQVLARKYSSPHLSRAADHLEHFLRQQEIINRQAQAAPPTPPCESAMPKPAPATNVFNTPHKGYGNTMTHGMMTPPITPEQQGYISGEASKGYGEPQLFPATPTPSTNPYSQQYQSYQPDKMMR